MKNIIIKYMKKFLLILIAIVFGTNLSFASDDLWDNFGDQNVYGQKPVSDKEFNTILEKLKGKKKEKVKDKDLKNGESFQQSNETQFINKVPEELPILLVPLNLALTDDAVLPVGHYQIIGRKENGKIYLKFYQSKDLLASVEAIETNDDFDEPTINFVKLKEYNPQQVIIIFGSVDFNAYAIVNIAHHD